MTISAATWRHPTASWRRKSSTTSPALTLSSSTARGRRPPRTMAMAGRRLSVPGHPSRTATTSQERSKEKTTKNDGYGRKEVVCTRTPKQDCYNIPRKIQVEVCKTDVHRYCEKTTKNDGYGQKEVVCTRTPKQDCYNIPRKIQ